MTNIAKALLTPGLQHLVAGLAVIGAVSGLAATGTINGADALGVIGVFGGALVGITGGAAAVTAANNSAGGNTP